MDVNDLLKLSGLRNLIDPQVIDLERVLLTAHMCVARNTVANHAPGVSL